MKLGFCIPPQDEARLKANPPETPEEFADEVIRAEGLNPLHVETALYRRVLDMVTSAFENHGDGCP